MLPSPWCSITSPAEAPHEPQSSDSAPELHHRSIHLSNASFFSLMFMQNSRETFLFYCFCPNPVASLPWRNYRDIIPSQSQHENGNFFLSDDCSLRIMIARTFSFCCWHCFDLLEQKRLPFGLPIPKQNSKKPNKNTAFCLN